jgi:hypothetical protein
VFSQKLPYHQDGEGGEPSGAKEVLPFLPQAHDAQGTEEIGEGLQELYTFI